MTSLAAAALVTTVAVVGAFGWWWLGAKAHDPALAQYHQRVEDEDELVYRLALRHAPA